MSRAVSVIGAGIVGISCALELQRRGFQVRLIDRHGIGEETSSGNAGILSYGNVTPIAAPALLRRAPRLVLNRDSDFRLHYPHLPRLVPWLLRFVWRCRHSVYMRDGYAMSKITLPSIEIHREWIKEAGVQNLVNSGEGGLKLYRNEKTFQRDQIERELWDRCGIQHAELQMDDAYALEPSLNRIFRRAVLVKDSISVRDPQKLCAAYAELFRSAGGEFSQQEIRAIKPDGSVWKVLTEQGESCADKLVVCLGAWTPNLLKALGYRNPLAIERGYHTVFEPQPGHALSRPIFDCDASYVMIPMETGLRVTTGTNLVYHEAEPDPRQIAQVSPRVREAFPVADNILVTPWMGHRPTVPDTLPLIGAAPSHTNLWLAFGHSHMGLTQGPISGRLIANAIEGVAQPFDAGFCDPARYL